MTKKASFIDLDKLSPAVRAQLDDSPKPRGRKPGSKNHPKAKHSHGFALGQPRGRFVRFTYEGKTGQEVYLAGDFNDWNPTAKRLLEVGEGKYTIRCLVPPGRHEYKFVINGQWVLDAANVERSCNERGDCNNVIVID